MFFDRFIAIVCNLDLYVPLLYPNGQLISECLFGVLNFPKNQRKIWQISAPEAKKWSNHEIKAPYSIFNTSNSPYNHSNIWSIKNLTITVHSDVLQWPGFLWIKRSCKKVPSLCWFDHFLVSRAEICQNFVVFLENLKTSKRHSEIIWPLVTGLFLVSSSKVRCLVSFYNCMY